MVIRRKVQQPPCQMNSANSVPVAMARCQKESCEFPTLRKTVNKMGRTLYCPECNQSFVGNKMRRLQSHIELNHVGNADHLLRVVEGKYKKVVKTGLKFICKVCNKTLRGSSTHVKMHHLKEHQGIPFEGIMSSKHLRKLSPCMHSTISNDKEGSKKIKCRGRILERFVTDSPNDTEVQADLNCHPYVSLAILKVTTFYIWYSSGGAWIKVNPITPLCFVVVSSCCNIGISYSVESNYYTSVYV
ncbi:hypothetical protein ONE63_011159 [Megalurothrips usitatus]|uniref:C2H2-type domain-containing protein n=1 Tax=Megalurothrips usitatus TaxID=439358 RepID=A0AAV7X018_9NEOP|nr:hypothetical protein ONE63_011159 [Megalurothrips usitatus]